MSEKPGGLASIQSKKPSPCIDDFSRDSNDFAPGTKGKSIGEINLKVPPNIRIDKSNNEISADMSSGSMEQPTTSSMNSDKGDPRSPTRASQGRSKFGEKKPDVLESILKALDQKKDPKKLEKSNEVTTEPVGESLIKSSKYRQWLDCEKRQDHSLGKTELILYCKWCRNSNQDSDFARGYSFSEGFSFQNPQQAKVFKDHKKSQQHIKAKEGFLTKTYGGNDLLEMSTIVDDYSIKLYNTIGLLLDLLKQNVSIEASIEIMKNAVMRGGAELSTNDISFISLRELIKTISDYLRDKTVKEINASPYFSIILCPWPPSSFSGIRSFEVVCYYINKGVPKSAYLDTVVLRDAEYCGLLAYKRLVSLFKKIGIEYQQKLIGLFTNGDLFFNGKGTGLSDLLKKEVSDVIAIHPISYRYFTVSTQNYGLTKAFPVVEHVFQLCLEIFHYFNASQKTIQELFENKAEIEELLIDTSGSRNPGTKWSCLIDGIVRIAKLFPKIYASLKESQDYHGHGLESQLRNPQYISWLHFMSDFGPYITSVGSVFRDKKLSLRGKVKTLLGFKKKIQDQFLTEELGPGFKEGFWAHFSQNLKDVDNESWAYDAIKLSGKVDVEKLQKDFKRFVEIFVEEIDRRYENVYELESIGMFDLAYLKEKSKDPKEWPALIEKVKESGAKFLKVLGKEEFVELLTQELPGLVKYIRENCLYDSKATTLNELFFFCQDKFPVCIDLISRFYLMPFNLGDIEKSLRAFGKIQGRIKGSMADEQVRAILMLNLHIEEGDEGKVLLERYVEEWKKKIQVN